MSLSKKGGTASDPSFLEPRVSQLESKASAINDANRQSQVLQHGLSVINASMDSPVDVEIQGRTLVSLGSSVLDAAKNYVLADKKTKVKFADGTTYSGVSKFVGKSEKPALIRVANFEGKVSGSTVEVPHIIKSAYNQTTLQTPTGAWTNGEASVGDYSAMSKLDGQVKSYPTTLASGYMAQSLFSFDIIAEVERQIGRIPKATLAEKVQWCKDNVKTLTFNWYGYGSSVGGNKSSFDIWYTDTNQWFSQINAGIPLMSHTNGMVTKLNTVINTIPNKVDSNGLTHFLAYAPASDGTTVSTINTDYLELEIELKPNAVLHDPLVPLYEVDATEYPNILVSWNEAEVLNRYPRVQGVQHVQSPYVIAEGENLLQQFSEWSLHANATFKTPYSIEVNATAPGQYSTAIVDVVPNTTYSLSLVGGDFNAYDYTSGSIVGSNLCTTSNGTASITTPTGCRKLLIRIASATNGVFLLSNPMLTLGSTAKPFTPRNLSYLFATTKLGQIGSAKDMLFKQDGQWFVRKSVEKDLIVDGSLNVRLQADHTGFKRVIVPLTTYSSDTKAIMSKFDSKQLAYDNTTNAGSQIDTYRIHIDYGGVVLSVSDIDSCWGETYSPIDTEVKAYFNGWQAKTVDGTGKPTAWRSLGDGTDATTQTLAYVSTNKAPNYTPYKLSYVLATPQVVPVNVEGDIAVNGLTQVEVGSGVIVREKVTPVTNAATTNNYFINNIGIGSSIPDSPLKNRAAKILDIYKNSQKDTAKWLKATTGMYGYERVYTDKTNFDTTAEYAVTYLVLDRHLFTANGTEVKTSFDTSLKSVVDSLVERQADLMTVGSVNVQAIAELYKRVKALGG